MKLIIDISEDLYNNMKSRFKYQNETDDNLSVFEKIRIAVKDGIPLEAQPTEECEENGSPWCLGHCSYRNTPQCPYENTIHREEVLKIIDNLNDLSYRWNIAKNLINKLPPATPQRPKGKWIELKNKRGTTIALRCSICKKSPIRGIRSDFCPNCGSYNGGETNDK